MCVVALAIASIKDSNINCFFQYGPNPASFLFSSFSQYNDKYSIKFYCNSTYGVLGIQTQDRWVVGIHESTVQ